MMQSMDVNCFKASWFTVPTTSAGTSSVLSKKEKPIQELSIAKCGLCTLSLSMGSFMKVVADAESAADLRALAF